MRSAERTRVSLLAPSVALALRASLRLLRPHPAALIICLSKRKKPKKKTPDDLPLANARGSLRFSPFPARVNSRSLIAQTCTRLFPETAVMLGSVNGTGVQIVGYGVPRPPWCSRAPQGKTGRSEDCLSDRRSRVPQRRFWSRSTGKSQRSGDPALGCLFFGLPFFGQAKKGNAGALSTAPSKTITLIERINPTQQPLNNRRTSLRQGGRDTSTHDA